VKCFPSGGDGKKNRIAVKRENLKKNKLLEVIVIVIANE